MPSPDDRLDELLGTGAATFRASFDLLGDPVAVHWAIRDAAGVVIDFESCYANPAMARVLGISMEQTLGRRLVEESPAYRDDPRSRGCAASSGPACQRSWRRWWIARHRSAAYLGCSRIARSPSARMQ